MKIYNHKQEILDLSGFGNLTGLEKSDFFKTTFINIKKILILICLFNLYSCNKTDKKVQNDETAKENPIKYAKNFSLEYQDGYKILHISKAFEEENKETFTFVLLPERVEKPVQYLDNQVIRIPVKEIAFTATTQLAYLTFVDDYSKIVAVGKTNNIYDSTLRKYLEKEKIPEIGVNKSLNTELVFSIQPDVLITGGMPYNTYGIYKGLIEAGIPVIIFSSWLETHPLGSLEWVKVLAALTDKEEEVYKKFDEIEQAYLQTKELTQNIKDKPKVFKGLNYKNAWYANGKDSYLAQYLKDAGADYYWKEEKGNLLVLDFEAVYPVGINTEYWLNPGMYIHNKEDLINQDERYEDFKAFQSGRVYNNNLRMRPEGGQDYFQSGAINPHIILKDLVKIFHPDLLPEHQLYYYKKIN